MDQGFPILPMGKVWSLDFLGTYTYIMYIMSVCRPQCFLKGEKIQKLSTGVKINHLCLRDEMGIDFEAHLFKTCIYL